MITHQVKGCHIWALNGARPAVNQTIRLHPGQTLTIRNNDVMPHQLIKTSGSAIVMRLLAPGMMSTGTHEGALRGRDDAAHGFGPRVSFPKAGTYVLKTKAGEDYMAGVKTVGEDNVLKVKVVVG